MVGEDRVKARVVRILVKRHVEVLNYVGQGWIPASIKDVKRSVARNIIQQRQTSWVADPRSQHYKTVEKLVSTKSKF